MMYGERGYSARSIALFPSSGSDGQPFDFFKGNQRWSTSLDNIVEVLIEVAEEKNIHVVQSILIEEKKETKKNGK